MQIILEMCGKIHYDIIGSGQGEDKIVAAISANKMEAVVTMHGYIENHRLPKYFAKANVGVSYVPINSKYDLQPLNLFIKIIELVKNGIL